MRLALKKRNPTVADQRGYYKFEQWTKDSQCVEQMLWGGISIALYDPPSIKVLSM